MDSGGSHHATGNKTLLSKVRPHRLNKFIMIADNSPHPVVKGVQMEVSLVDVYHVPGLRKNLASVSQIADAGRYVLFYPHDVKIIFHVKHLEVMFYLVERKKIICMYCLKVMHILRKHVKNVSSTCWHARLGHVGYQLLHKFFEKKLLVGVPQFKKIHSDVVYSGCEYGKSH